MNEDHGNLKTVSCSVSLTSCRLKAESLARALNNKIWSRSLLNVGDGNNDYDKLQVTEECNSLSDTKSVKIIDKAPQSHQIYGGSDNNVIGHCWINGMQQEEDEEEYFDTPTCSSPPSLADDEDIIVNPPVQLGFSPFFSVLSDPRQTYDRASREGTSYAPMRFTDGRLTDQNKLYEKLQKYAESLPQTEDGLETFYDAASDDEEEMLNFLPEKKCKQCEICSDRLRCGEEGLKANQSSAKDVKVNQTSAKDVKVNQTSAKDVKVNQTSAKDVKVNQTSAKDVKVNQTSAKDDVKGNDTSTANDIKGFQSSTENAKAIWGSAKEVELNQCRADKLVGSALSGSDPNNDSSGLRTIASDRSENNSEISDPTSSENCIASKTTEIANLNIKSATNNNDSEKCSEKCIGIKGNKNAEEVLLAKETSEEKHSLLSFGIQSSSNPSDVNSLKDSTKNLNEAANDVDSNNLSLTNNNSVECSEKCIGKNEGKNTAEKVLPTSDTFEEKRPCPSIGIQPASPPPDGESSPINLPENLNETENEVDKASEENLLNATDAVVSNAQHLAVDFRLRRLQELVEEDRPKLLRSTSLKTVRTPPGSPGQKKIVRFADALGLDLEDVRHIVTDDLPHVPISAYTDLNIPAEDLPLTSSSEKDATDDTITLSDSRPQTWDSFMPGTSSSFRTLHPQFKQPCSLPDFLDRVRIQRICLEKVVVSDLSVHCVARVLNIGYEKHVVARYTTTEWRSFEEVAASYVPSSSDGSFDKFAFSLFLPNILPHQQLSFALRYMVNNTEYWDSNRGENYVLRSHSNAPVLPSPEGGPSWLHHFC